MSPQTELNLSLLAIRVQSLTANLAFDFEPTVAGQPLQCKFGVGNQKIGRSVPVDLKEAHVESFVFMTTFEFKYFHTPSIEAVPIDDLEKHKLVANIQAEILSIYTGQALSQMNPDSLNIWGSRNAVLHQWPYWRELCHTSLMRMGLPVTQVPLWHPPSHAEVAAQLGTAGKAVSAPGSPAPKRRSRKKLSP